MEMYIKRYCMKFEVRNSNTTLHTSKAQMQCQKQEGTIRRCVIIRGHNKHTLIYHRIKSTSKWNMNHVEHTSYGRHYTGNCCHGWCPVGTEYPSVVVEWTLTICRVQARINNFDRKIECTPRITDGHQNNLKKQQRPRAGHKRNSQSQKLYLNYMTTEASNLNQRQ